MHHKIILSAMGMMCFTLASYLQKFTLSESLPTVKNHQIQTLSASLETKPSDYANDINSLTYPQKAEIIRQMIKDEFSESDPFVSKALILFGPKIILVCEKKGFKTPGERFAQLLLESSKIKDGQRIWSTLTLVHNNFGGVKACKGSKCTPSLKTEEVFNGKRGVYKLKFAAFDTKWDGMDKYLKIVSMKRYKKAMQLHGASHFKALANAGYCTEPPDSYASKCMSLYNRYDLQKLNKILLSWQQEYNSGSISQPLALAY